MKMAGAVEFPLRFPIKNPVRDFTRIPNSSFLIPH